MLPNKNKLMKLALALVCCLSLAACASSMLGGKVNHLRNFDEARLDKGQGAVVMHAINQGGLIATRWHKIDNPNHSYSFTVYRTDRHRALDQMNTYDVAMVEPGTYVLYSVFGNCEEGLRPGSTDWDEPWRESVATTLGMVSWLRSWKPDNNVSAGMGIWGGSGGRSGVGAGVGFDLGSAGVGSGPGTPLAICNFRSKGMTGGRPTLATITVKPGEIVYAGELYIDYAANDTCERSGNWMTDNETREYCGADWASLRVEDAYSSRARAFIEQNLGRAALDRTVVRPAAPGSMVSEQSRRLFR
ncbi:hypothetical protein LJB99_02645 [Deltaproteobacteria bacterium OttesenSCG-928-K17]|nr:hypothetical protein [Deltaproteobacteria bacterium OttesenSCG-928-K17]